MTVTLVLPPCATLAEVAGVVVSVKFPAGVPAAMVRLRGVATVPVEPTPCTDRLVNVPVGALAATVRVSTELLPVCGFAGKL